MKHICYLGLGRWPDGPGDPRIFQKQLAGAVHAGYRVTALVTGDGAPYDKNGIWIVPHPWHGGLFRRIGHLRSLLRAALEVKADIYWFGNFEVLPVAVWLKRLTGAKLIYDAMEHWPDMVRQSPFISRPLRGGMALLVDLVDRFLVRWVDMVLTADEPTGERYRTHQRSVVIFNFPRLSTFDQYRPESMSELQKRYDGHRVLGYVGSMGWDRGLREMVEALAVVRRKFPNSLLLLMGDFQVQTWLDELRALIAERDLVDHVEFLGTVPQEDLGAYLRVAEVGIAFLWDTPKHQKNIATKQFDYMCCGIPVIATDLEPMRRFTEAANAGLLVPSSGHEGLANCLIELLANPVRARALGQNGRQAVENGWNWESEERRLVTALAHLEEPEPCLKAST